MTAGSETARVPAMNASDLKRWTMSLVAATVIVGVPAGVLTSCPGCTVSQKTTAYRSLAAIATTVDAGMKAYADAVVAHKVPEDTQAKVKDIHGRYSAALQAAILASRFETQGAAPEDVQRLANELLDLVVAAVQPKGTP